MSQNSKIFAIICIFTEEFLTEEAMQYVPKPFLLALTVMIIASCGASYQTREPRSPEEAAEHALVVKALEDADFILDITQIIPNGFPSKTSTGEYQLRLEGDVVTTRLPFIGVSHEPVYAGVDEVSIVFEKEKVQLEKDFSKVSRKGEYVYKFTGGKGNDPWTVALHVFESGTATIACTSAGGRFMNFFANLVIPEKR